MNILCSEAKHLSILGSASRAPSRECTQFTKAVTTSFLQSPKAPSLITRHMACATAYQAVAALEHILQVYLV